MKSWVGGANELTAAVLFTATVTCSITPSVTCSITPSGASSITPSGASSITPTVTQGGVGNIIAKSHV